MALPIAAAVKALTKAGPVVGPQAVKLAKRLLGEKNLRKAAHDLAWQRRGLVGEVRFTDGAKRWVVVTAEHEPIAAFPPFGDGDPASLREGLHGVDFARCVGPSKRDAQERERAEREAAGAGDEEARRRAPAALRRPGGRRSSTRRSER